VIKKILQLCGLRIPGGNISSRTKSDWGEQLINSPTQYPMSGPVRDGSFTLSLARAMAVCSDTADHHMGLTKKRKRKKLHGRISSGRQCRIYSEAYLQLIRSTSIPNSPPVFLIISLRPRTLLSTEHPQPSSHKDATRPRHLFPAAAHELPVAWRVSVAERGAIARRSGQRASQPGVKEQVDPCDAPKERRDSWKCRARLLREQLLSVPLVPLRVRFSADDVAHSRLAAVCWSTTPCIWIMRCRCAGKSLFHRHERSAVVEHQEFIAASAGMHALQRT
jgi:hypothetical protein